MLGFRRAAAAAITLCLLSWLAGSSDAFVPLGRKEMRLSFTDPSQTSTETATSLRMALDLVTYLRTEWISAALCTNQTPRSASICLQLGTEDGRAINFIPRTIGTLITSSAEKDGRLRLSARRQLKQQQERRRAAKVQYEDQPADDLREVEDESVDVVISMQAAARMLENGLDWKKSVREAARVLKPGGRLLFVEQTDLDGDKYLAYVQNLYTTKQDPSQAVRDEPTESTGTSKKEAPEFFPVFEEVGFDDVDLVLVPHIAGVAIKSPEDAGMTEAEKKAKVKAEQEEELAELSIAAFERGLKKRKRKKKKPVKKAEGDEEQKE